MSDFRWDRTAGRYRDARTGRFVPPTAVRDALDTVLAGGTDRIRSLSDRLAAGKLSVADWQTGLARELRLLHTVAAAAGAGGWAQMTPADWGRTGQALRTQYAYLQRFAAGVADGSVPLARVPARAAAYADAARLTYEAQARVTAATAGMQEERNVLHAHESCPGCVAASGQGWVPLGTLPPIGARDCLSHCQCTLIYRAAPVARAA